LIDEKVFLDTLRQTPDDDVTRLVYADWLDEQGGKTNTVKSAFLRLQCDLARKQATTDFLQASKRLLRIARQVPTLWLAVVGNMPIENCQRECQTQCPGQWNKLRATARDDVRFCMACQNSVSCCHSVRAARRQVRRGRRVVVRLGVARCEGDLHLYRIAMGKSLSPEELADQREDEEELPVRIHHRRCRR
jgi:uncharacterized protein (TIGR02996 family)